MIYKIDSIIYDTADPSQLPKTLHIEVIDALDSYDKIEFISDEISNITGFCHLGFTTTPTINYKLTKQI